MTAATSSTASRRILVLGGGDAAVNAVELLAQLGLEPAILDTPSIERLEAVRDAGFAVVVAGPDDDASMMLAIGFMLALLGRARIALLGGDPPAALEGAVRVPLDDSGLWRLLLAREMKRAGLEVDLNKAL